jgi:starch phosphorylase
MERFKSFTVLPKVPEKLSFLQVLANNVWWSWNAEASSLFRRIDPELLRSTNFNPVEMLASVPQERLEELAEDTSFLSQMKSVEMQYNEEVLTSSHWEDINAPRRCIAYFSMEFGLQESIHIYSGGLGILAGDHLKAASDLDLPICAIGILYREGYFEQKLDSNGYQIEYYPENDVHTMPVSPVYDDNRNQIKISVPLPEGKLKATVWRLDVGRIPLFLLDTNLPENKAEFREVSGRLYGGDKLNRLRQEILLGIGGMRALEAMGYEVAVSHMNEGHAAFLGLERIAMAMSSGLSLDEAYEFVHSTSVFTTHTPVPAGNETFDLGLLYPHLKAIEAEGGVSASVAMAMGRAPGDTKTNELSMTILGLHCSEYSNGVSELHGVVERDMWKHLWPDFPISEVPIGHITNGVHVPTWLSSDNNKLFSSVLGTNWDKHPITQSQIDKIDHIRDEDLWRVHEAARSHMIRVAREHLERCCMIRNDSFEELAAVRNVLDKDALTIGFARRFATYKRATLLFSDPARLKRILLNPSRPVQIVFAGKAHPADEEGKRFIQEVVRFSKDPELKGRIVFLENYNIRIARRLVRGVDVWLNTPRRPNEASGTSGMKACMNGAIHVSSLDGWWPEGYSRECGWAIGTNGDYHSIDIHDQSDAQALYNLLESEIIPTFYDRPFGELPVRWIAMMKASIKMSLRRFSSMRMVEDYHADTYEPAFQSYDSLIKDDFAAVRRKVAVKKNILSKWDKVRIGFPQTNRDLAKTFVGDEFEVIVKVQLEDVSPQDVSVEFFSGTLDSDERVLSGTGKEMEYVKELSGGTHLYKQVMKCENVGTYGYSARVMPKDKKLRSEMPGHIAWASKNL